MKFRLRLKNAYDKLLDKNDKEEFFEQLRSLNFIDPFRHAWLVVIGVLVLLLFKWYSLATVLSVLYVIWTSLYLVTFLGVYYMWKKKVGKR